MSVSFVDRLKSLLGLAGRPSGQCEILDADLHGILDSLAAVRLSGHLPGPLRGPLRELCRRCAVLLDLGDCPPPEAAEALPDLRKLSARLSALDRRGQAQGKAESWSGEADSLYSALMEMNKRVSAMLPSRRAALLKAQEEVLARKALDPLTARLRALLEQLGRNRAEISPALQGRIDGISASAARILGHMESEHNAIKGGARFLNRYLGAAEQLSGDLVRLRQSRADRSRVAELEGKGGALLARLEEVFSAQAEALLTGAPSPALKNLGQELDALDKLLKM